MARGHAGRRAAGADRVPRRAVARDGDRGTGRRRAGGVDAAGSERVVGRSRRHGHDPDPPGAPAMIDPVQLQVLTGALRAICEEMGAVLIHSAHSAHIKERRDASTGLFDSQGELSGQMRQPEQRRADLRAQLAANRAGARRLAELWERFGRDTVVEAFREVLDYAERRTRACLEELDDGERVARDVLEARQGDLEIVLTATVEGDRLTLDFEGTAEQHDGNLNCPLAVTGSACYFAIRVLTDPDIPPSAGAYRPVEVRAPEGSLLNARPPAAVVGGNVETSSRVADVVLAAFGRALGQGTMNNVVIGSQDVVYYETIGGGQGACPDADGPSGVHVAMSNTLNTPVEALELEFPLRIVEYSQRRRSGGQGRHSGGDGVIREVEAM